MKNSLSYAGINPIIVSVSKNLSHGIVIKLQLPRHEQDDILQTMLIAGVRWEQEYRPGQISLSTYLTERLTHLQIDLLRAYQAEKRRTYLHQIYEYEEMDEDGETSTLLERIPSTDACSDVVGSVQVRDVLKSLSGKECELADLLMQGYTTKEAAGIMGEKPRKIELMRVKIRESAKKLKKYAGILAALRGNK